MLGVIAYLLELQYWKDLTISGYTWVLIKPLLFFVTSLFLMLNGKELNAYIYWASYLWAIYWYACMSCVQNTRKLRRFFRYGNFKVIDLIIFTIIDYLFISLALLLFLLPIALYLKVDFMDIELYLLIFLVFSVQIIFLIYLGMLSVNALDISYVFMFIPILLLFLLMDGNLSQYLLMIMPYFYFVLRIEVDINYLLISMVITGLLGIFVYKYLKLNYKQIYRNSIA